MSNRQPVVMCWSGGKDSALALHELRQSAEFEVVALLTTMTRDVDRISMHGVRRELLQRQREALGLPAEEVWITQGASNAEYEGQMDAALTRFRREGVSFVAFGDIFLEDLRIYRERNLARLGMEALFPIWKRPTDELIATFLGLGFRSTTCCIDTRKLDESFVGREIDEQFVRALPAGVDPCGENGEFHSFAWSGPIFGEDIPICCGETVRRDSFLFCDLLTK
ncbi:MAG TPA: ATP-binding protein [Planctomycetaceae bacterium]|jgi:uncharacterized protein (TIGR00290 family)|nr:ATP-binding protein [Planctomycetaceae bacterium]